MAIRKLPLLLVNQIAAGEVIERPASVVKELIENSLDAGATHLDITIEQGGQKLIRVADNGQGIPADQLHLAVAPHATSKLTSPQQLASINTLGFRGEALASIASVSRLRLTSRATQHGQPDEAGATLEATGDQVSTPTPASCAPGTTLEIRDLFYNTPVRRKFMRTAATEFGHIVEAVSRIAMLHPHAAFKLTHGSRTSLDLPANQTKRQRCVALLGQELDEALLEFESTPPTPTDGIDPAAPLASVWGLAGLPAIARSTTRSQYLCVNGRPIRDRSAAHAVKEAYRGLIPPDKHPVAVVMIQVDPEAVDVNVHPAKAEVRFRDSVRIHGLVLSAMRQRLLGSDLTPRATLASPSVSPTVDPTPPDPDAGQANTAHQPTAAYGSTPASPPGAPAPQPADQALANYLKHAGPTQKGFDFDQVKQALTDTPTSTDPAAAAQQPDASSHGNTPVTQQPPPHTDADQAAIPRPPAPATPTHEPILQVYDTYLVTQDDQGLIIVDQHALHERVMFEQLRQRVLVASQSLESQRLLMPAVIKATPKRLALLDQLKPLTQRIGIEAGPIGPDAVAVHAFPTFLFDRRVDPVTFVDQLLEQAEAGQLGPLPDPAQTQANTETTPPLVEEAVLHKVLDMMACKAAVKAGDTMTHQEIQALLDKKEEIERSSACPHGRPTAIRITQRDMEKQFHRR